MDRATTKPHTKLYIKKCVICGTEYQAHHNAQKYCSDICRNIGHDLKREAWIDRNPDYYRIYNANITHGKVELELYAEGKIDHVEYVPD